jgi:hypothetical protein
LKEKKNVTVIEALDKVIGYLHEEQDDYEDTHASERQNHIWNAVHVLMRHRADLSNPPAGGRLPANVCNMTATCIINGL